jgi:hypothetical protein
MEMICGNPLELNKTLVCLHYLAIDVNWGVRPGAPFLILEFAMTVFWK